MVYHHQNTANPQHCFIRLFKKYFSLCPADAPADAFYLQPSRMPMETCWFSRRALGYHPLSITVARICKAAGIEGYKTNHSLRATSTTRHESLSAKLLVKPTPSKSHLAYSRLLSPSCGPSATIRGRAALNLRIFLRTT